MDVLAAMRTFVAIVEEGSLTAAAQTIGRSPPTVVRSLAALEDHLGTRLLNRTTRQMKLTEEGQDYLARCRRILADLDEAEQILQATHADPRGPLRVTAPVLFGERHLNDAVVDFARAFPQVEVDLVLLDRFVDLVEEGFDVGVRIGALADSSMVAVPVGKMRRVVAASPALLARDGVPQTPEALLERPCLQHAGSSVSPRWHFSKPGQAPGAGRADRDDGIAIRPVFRSNQVTSVVSACVAGLGFGSFLYYQVEPELRSGRLQLVLENCERPAVPVQIVYPDARLMSPRIRLFVDALKAALRAPRGIDVDVN